MPRRAAPRRLVPYRPWTRSGHRSRLAAWCLLVLAAWVGPAAAQVSDEDRAAFENGLQVLLGKGLETALGGGGGGAVPGAGPEATLAGAGAGAVPGDASDPAAPGMGGPRPPAFTEMPSGRFEFHARALPVVDALAELRQLVRRNIVVSPDVSASFTGDLYDVTVEQVLDAICTSSGLVYRDEGGFLFVERDKPETRIFELAHARADDVLGLLQPLLSPLGRITATPAPEVGIVSTPDGAGGNDYAYRDLVVINDYASHLDHIAEVIRLVDESPLQVLIEATIIAVNLTDDMEFGVEFTALGGVDFADANASSQDGLSLDLGTDTEPAFDGDELVDGVANGTTNLLTGIATGGLNVGYLNDNLAVFVRALEVVTDTTVLANPRITTMNKQRGEVLLGRRDGFLQSIVTETSTTQQVEFLETGTRLIYRPFIMGEDLVRLEIHPEDSSGGLNADGLPFKETAEITTNITVRHGQTVVVGGLFREKQVARESKVPVLGDIPLVGGAFRSESNESVRQEILIVITPYILDPTAEPAALGADTEAAGPTVAVAPPVADAAQRDRVRSLLVADRPDRRVPSGMAGRLADNYLGLAATLVDRGDYGSAAILLDSVGPTGAREDVDAVRSRLWSLWDRPTTSQRIDDVIYHRMIDGSLGSSEGP